MSPLTALLGSTPSHDAPFHLSTHAYHRAPEVSYTMADLYAADLIDAPHVADALQYRKHGGLPETPGDWCCDFEQR